MNSLVPIMIAIALIALTGVLGIGIFAMVKGGDFNKKYGNKLMQARVFLQTLVVLLLALAYFLSQN